MRPRAEGEERPSPALVLLFVGLLGPPIVWLAALQAAYSLASFACTAGLSRLPMQATTLIGIALIAVTAAVSWRGLRANGIRGPVDAGAPGHRSRFLALGGLVLGAQFALVLVAQALALVVLDPCF